MVKLTIEQRRAFRILSRHPNGCTEATMLAHGFKVDQIARLQRRLVADHRGRPEGSRAIMPRVPLFAQPIGAMTLGNMRELGGLRL
jgi:hypothetical protein